MPTAAAFFDLDRTLMSGSSAFYFGKAVYREGMLPLHRLTRDALSTLMFKLFGASDEKSEKTRDRILAAVAGQEAEQFHRLSPGVIEELLPRIRPEAQALLDMHEQAGRDVWILSASPIEIVAELAKALDITGGIGTESEIVDGVYTGRLAAPFCYGEGKAEHIRRLAEEHGYDLQQCYSYSDSASDLPMMQIVGNPIAVNPDRPMMAVAHRRGWPVVEFNRERKQIIRLAFGTSGALTAGTAGYLLGRRHGRKTASLQHRAGRLLSR
jgi:HAD superfamily hydrolase (TIGR01490 family)